MRGYILITALVLLCTIGCDARGPRERDNKEKISSTLAMLLRKDETKLDEWIFITVLYYNFAGSAAEGKYS